MIISSESEYENLSFGLPWEIPCSPELDQWLPEQADASDVEHQVLVSLDAAYLRKQLRALPRLERQVLTWHYGIGCSPVSFGEIAKRLGVSRASAHRVELRALDLLRERWDDSAWETHGDTDLEVAA